MFFKNENHKTKFIQAIKDENVNKERMAYLYLVLSVEEVSIVDALLNKAILTMCDIEQEKELEIIKIGLALLNEGNYDINNLITLPGMELKMVLEAIKIAAGKMTISISEGNVNTYTAI